MPSPAFIARLRTLVPTAPPPVVPPTPPPPDVVDTKPTPPQPLDADAATSPLDNIEIDTNTAPYQPDEFAELKRWANRLGLFLFGLWQICAICNNTGWIIIDVQNSGEPATALASPLRTVAVISFANGLWAGWLTRRNWSGQRGRFRRWFYLAYTVGSTLTGLALIVVHGDLIF